MNDEPGMVIMLTMPFSEVSGKGIDEIIEYLQGEVACMRDTILTGLMENYFEAERSGHPDPSGIN